MFSPERQPHPSVHEIKYLQQPVQIALDPPVGRLAIAVTCKGTLVADESNGRKTSLRLRNRYTFLELDHLIWKWQIVSSLSDKALAEGLASTESDRLVLDLTSAGMWCGNEDQKTSSLNYFVNILGVLREDAAWADAGHLVAREQFRVTLTINSGAVPRSINKQHSARPLPGFEPLLVNSDDDRVTVLTADKTLQLVISKFTGGIVKLLWNSRNITGGNGLQSCYTRATTDNDRGGMELVLEHMMISWLKPAFFLLGGTRDFSHYMHWKENGLTQDNPPKNVCTGVNMTRDKGGVIFVVDCDVTSASGTVLLKQTTTYKIGQEGNIWMGVRIVPTKSIQKIPSLPRVGLSLELAPDLSRIQYYGRGPYENYPDRKSSALFGVWKTSPSEMAYNYIVPSENGSRSDCQWISFESTDGGGLLIAADGESTFGCSALLHSATELNNALHTSDLDARRDGLHPIHVNIDHRLMGVAGDVSWFPCVYPPFLVKAEPYEYA